jgi:hypothetical protein
MKPEERDAVVIEQCAMVCERLAREWVRADAGTSAYAAQDCANAIRALTAQSPAGVPPEPPTDVWGHSWTSTTTDGLGNKGIVWHNPAPNAAAPSVVTSGYSVVIGPAGVPTTEPIAQPNENEQLERMRERLRKANQSPMHADALSSREPATDGTPPGGPTRLVGIRDGGTAEPVAPIAREPVVSASLLARICVLFERNAASHDLAGEKDRAGTWRGAINVVRQELAAAPQAPVEPVAQEPLTDDAIRKLMAHYERIYPSSKYHEQWMAFARDLERMVLEQK